MVAQLLTLVNQLRILHWQTESYAEHQAYGGAYDALSGLIDTFIEQFSNANAKIVSSGGFNIQLKNLNEITDIVQYLDSYIQFLSVEIPKVVKPTDTNLLNIRDEMIGEIQKLKYLLTLE